MPKFNTVRIGRAVESMLSELQPDPDVELEQEISAGQDLIDEFKELIHGIPGLGYMTHDEVISATSVVLADIDEDIKTTALAIFLVHAVRESQGTN